VPENEWKRPTVNMAVCEEGRGGERETRQAGEGGEVRSTRLKREGCRRGEEEDVMCTTAAVWRVGSHSVSRLIWSTNDAPHYNLFKHTHFYRDVRPTAGSRRPVHLSVTLVKESDEGVGAGAVIKCLHWGVCRHLKAVCVCVCVCVCVEK